MFYVVGLGLGDVKDITVKGLEIVKKCDRVYLEAYTSILIDDMIDKMVMYCSHILYSILIYHFFSSL